MAENTKERDIQQDVEEKAAESTVETETDVDENITDEVAETEADEVCEDSEDSAQTAEETDAAEETDEASGEEAKKGSKFFKKKEKNKDKEKIAELEDKVLRQMAEFENFRRRTEKEKSQMFETGAKSVIEKLLPVVDNFERAMVNVTEGDAFADGIQMIYKQLMTELDNMGVKPIEAVGTEFNPDFHNAVMQVTSEEFESGMVAQELQKGYTYHDAVVRHSMVAVVE